MNLLRDDRAFTPAGFPHSEILGSKPVCGSPRLIAAYRVLRRLSAPRHPPCTLSSLTKLEFSLIRRILSLLTRFSCQRASRIDEIRGTVIAGLSAAAQGTAHPKITTYAIKNLPVRSTARALRPSGWWS